MWLVWLVLGIVVFWIIFIWVLQNAPSINVKSEKHYTTRFIPLSKNDED